ncbi:MAG: dNTP triphosphohydrolase [Bacteroidales bacterium]|jgi:dGTPase|nr:dNTP triphosphohydrolase [Bacteroidales bacterium]
MKYRGFYMDDEHSLGVAEHLKAKDTRAKRLHGEASHPYRGNYQRDRDRILYTTSFRRLIGKTQIFNVGMGEHYRNRLTHTLEVMQIATTISKHLGLNLELTEAIALGHDIGHAPFGHIGERTLNYFMNNCDILNKYNIELRDKQKGFKHNLQALRILLDIEKNSRNYNGVNITTDTLWGIANHTKKRWKECEKIDGVHLTCLMRRNRHDFMCVNIHDNIALQDVDFYDQYIQKIQNSWTFEAYVVKYADEIAQRHHDIEDGIISGIFDPQNILGEINKKIRKKYGRIYREFKNIYNELRNILKKEEEENYLLPILARYIVDLYVTNYISSIAPKIKTFIKEHSIEDNDSFYSIKDKIWKDEDGENGGIDNIMSFGGIFREFDDTIQDLLKKSIIHSRKAQLMDGKGTFIIRKLFEAYISTPNQLPDSVIARLFQEFEKERKIKTTKFLIGEWRTRLDTRELLKNNDFLLCLCRNICDYISSMADRYALKQYEKLYGSSVLS